MVFTKIVERKSEKKFFLGSEKKNFLHLFFKLYTKYFQNASANYDLVSHPKWNPYLLYDRAYTEVSF